MRCTMRCRSSLARLPRSRRREDADRAVDCRSASSRRRLRGLVSLGIALNLLQTVAAQAGPIEANRVSPEVLPGNGLAAHDFLYAGESKNRRAFIVKQGRVVWSYDDPAGRGEISDAVLLSDGNLLLAHQFAVKLISPEKKVLWNVDAPKGTEIHTAAPIGHEHVLYVQNGDPAVVKVVNISTGEIKN